MFMRKAHYKLTFVYFTLASNRKKGYDEEDMGKRKCRVCSCKIDVSKICK